MAESAEKVSIERIYIGGLDPQRLTAQEVASRLDSVAGIEVVSKGDVAADNDKVFLHVAVTKTDVNDTRSALEIISKQYHNVKWKGCKLSVEAARPHLLERLAQERRERDQETNSREVQLTKQAKPNGEIPRHLRIRQRFGKEAYRVDTKPSRVSEWPEFTRVVIKMRSKQEKHREQLLEALKKHDPEAEALKKKLTFFNRSVHLRFDHSQDALPVDGVPPLDALDTSSSDEEYDAEGLPKSSDTSEDDSQASETFISRATKVGHSTKGYAWSDDESSDDDEVNIPKSRVKVLTTGDRDKALVPAEFIINSSRDEVSFTPESDADSVEASRNDGVMPHDALTKLAPNIASAGEFSAALDFREDIIEEDGSDDCNMEESTSAHELMDEKVDLYDDVKANLNVLSSLFPDLADTAPKPVRGSGSGGIEGSAANEATQSTNRTTQIGWEMAPSNKGETSISAGLGLMQRFDPTKESAKKYIIEPDVSDQSADVTNEAVNEIQQSNEVEDLKTRGKLLEIDGSSNESDLDLAESKPVYTNESTVYKQNELEDIFRQARNPRPMGVEAFQLTSQSKEDPASIRKKDPSEGLFAFAFDLGGAKDASLKLSNSSIKDGGALTFDVEIGEGSEQVRSAITVAKGPVENKTASKKQGIRRRGLLFPKPELEKQVDAFFIMNDGARILDNVESFRNDEGVKKQWLKERSTLTLDWKRKKKYAQSRMQKRMKFR